MMTLLLVFVFLDIACTLESVADTASSVRGFMNTAGTVAGNQAKQAVKSRFFTVGGLTTIAGGVALSKLFSPGKSMTEALKDGTGFNALKSTGKYIGKHSGKFAAAGALVGGAYALSRYLSRRSIGEDKHKKEEEQKAKDKATAHAAVGAAKQARGAFGMFKTAFALFR